QIGVETGESCCQESGTLAADSTANGVNGGDGHGVEDDLHEGDGDGAAPEEDVNLCQEERIERRQITGRVKIREAGIAMSGQQIDGVGVIAGRLQTQSVAEEKNVSQAKGNGGDQN